MAGLHLRRCAHKGLWMTAEPHALDPLFKPRSVAFIGGSNLNGTLRYHRDLAFAGETFLINPKYEELQGFKCLPSIEALPYAPDLAFVGIRREAAIEAIDALRQIGCKAIVCNAAGFAETGPNGVDLQKRLIAATGDMAMIGPNSAGLVNYLEPMAAMLDHFGIHQVETGVAICSQGGGFLCDAVFSDRGLPITHMVGAGNQAVTGLDACIDYLLDDPRVTAIGLSFEGLRNIDGLRKAAHKALHLGKPIVAIKFGKTAAGAHAAASHTASMTGAGASWEALFDRLGIISTDSESEFFETLKLCHSGQMPKGRRVLVTAVSGVMGVMLADHLSAAGFELPQPSGARIAKLREVLPAIATPANPQDVTMAAWNNVDQQTAIYSTLIEEGYDTAIMVQNYPREGMWDVKEYDAQVEALAAACAQTDIAGMQLAPMVDCFPVEARNHTQALGLAAMQGLEECIKAMNHALWWRERSSALASEDAPRGDRPSMAAPSVGRRWNEPEAKRLLTEYQITVPDGRVVVPEKAAETASEIGFPVALKAVDERLLHKTEVGAVRIGLQSASEVAAAIATMRVTMAERVPHIPLNQVLVEQMATDVVAEVMASVTFDAAIGPVMMIAGGGIEAELWNDSTLLAAPFARSEMARALERLKVNQRLKGWRGRPAGDREALLTLLERLADFAMTTGAEEIEINPILVGTHGAWAVDAVLKLADAAPEQATENVA